MKKACLSCLFPCHKIFCKSGGPKCEADNPLRNGLCNYACTNSARSLAKKTKKFCACKDQRLPGRRGLIRTAGSGPRPVAGAHVAQVSHGARPHPFFPDTRSLFFLLTCMWGPRGGASRSSCTEQLGQTERSGPSGWLCSARGDR